jgi:hypothetical protein
MKGCARYVIMAGIIAAACSIAAPVARADVPGPQAAFRNSQHPGEFDLLPSLCRVYTQDAC